jgi:hypothetical protein
MRVAKVGMSDWRGGAGQGKGDWGGGGAARLGRPAIVYTWDIPGIYNGAGQRNNDSGVGGAARLGRPAEELPLGLGDLVGVLEARLVQSLLHVLPVDALVEPVEVVVSYVLQEGEGGRG